MKPVRVVALGILALMVAASGVVAAEKAGGRSDAPGRWLKIRVYENDAKTPTVLVNIPFALARAALRFAAATGTLHAHMNHGEIQVETGGKTETVRPADKELQDLIREIEALPPGQIVEVQDGEDRVSIWIE